MATRKPSVPAAKAPPKTSKKATPKAKAPAKTRAATKPPVKKAPARASAATKKAPAKQTPAKKAPAKTKAPAKKAPAKKSGGRKAKAAPWSLWVYYPLSLHEVGALDEQIEGAVGRLASGRGAGLEEEALRDISFDFPGENEAKAAVERVERLGLDRVRTSILPPGLLQDPPGKFVLSVSYPESRLEKLEEPIIKLVGSRPTDQSFCSFDGSRGLRWLYDTRKEAEAMARRVLAKYKVSAVSFETRPSPF